MKAEIKQLKSRVDSLERKDAEKFTGYELGKIKPVKSKKAKPVSSEPAAVDNALPVYIAPRSSSYGIRTSGRCQAIIRKGTQCLRSALSGGYCWQQCG